MTRTLIALFSGGLMFVALPAMAQIDLSGTGDMTALTISADPHYPGPDSIVQLTAESPLLDLEHSDITWSVNGAPAGSGQSVRIPLGAIGEETDVKVSVSGSSGSDSATLALVPTSIDLLWEADSYVPPFYRGRAVPGSGSTIRVLAVPHFASASGSEAPPSTVDFTWKLNGAVDKAQSGIGESSAVFPAAILYGSDIVDVVAETADGSRSGESSVSIRTQGPQLVLYEDNPLFGIMYHRAVPSTSVASESETSFAAVPYFANAPSPNDPSLAYEWTVNDASVSADPEDPSEITINAQSSGTANIALLISSPDDPFFSAFGSWQIAFSRSAVNGNDVFHSSP